MTVLATLTATDIAALVKLNKALLDHHADGGSEIYASNECDAGMCHTKHRDDESAWCLMMRFHDELIGLESAKAWQQAAFDWILEYPGLRQHILDLFQSLAESQNGTLMGLRPSRFEPDRVERRLAEAYQLLMVRIHDALSTKTRSQEDRLADMQRQTDALLAKRA